jgi:hypothetical protein
MDGLMDESVDSHSERMAGWIILLRSVEACIVYYNVD